MDEKPKPLTKKEVLEALDEMIKTYDELPPHALSTYITHYEHQSLLLILSAALRAEDAS